jgi:hypothetical protein
VCLVWRLGRGFQAQKSQKEIVSEIQAIIRQITSSVAFLPLLRERCSFDMLVRHTVIIIILVITSIIIEAHRQGVAGEGGEGEGQGYLMVT